MLKYFSKIRHSLISKLIVSVGLVLLVSLAIWTYFNINYQKKKSMAAIVASTDRLTSRDFFWVSSPSRSAGKRW